jgi:hypothetical protein
MNFKDLMSRISEIEGSGNVPHDSTASPLSHVDSEIEECGMPGMSGMPSGMMGMREEPPKQSDSVTMNVSMNGSGAGGIRDLMSLLRNIEHGEEEMDMPAELPIVSIARGMDDHGDDEHHDSEELLGGMGEEYANEPDEMYGDMSSAIQAGDDMHKPKTMHRRAQPGDNPMAAESLKSKLQNLYTEVKSR